MATGRISVVICSYQRLPALRESLPQALELEGVDQVVVVVDGSTDGTAEWLSTVENDRLKVVSLVENRGLPFARNSGVVAAAGDWILFLDDDVLVPPDYAVALKRAADVANADIVGAPWVRCSVGTLESTVVDRRRDAVGTITFATGPGEFPSRIVETAFLNSYMLIARKVFVQQRYDESIRGNAYREETTFSLAARRNGFRSVVTPETYTYQYETFDGGCHEGSRLMYEASLVRNNWRFLRRFEADLVAAGEIRTARRAQATFVAKRWSAVARGVLGARWTRLRALGMR